MRRRLADGSVKEYVYDREPRRAPSKFGPDSVKELIAQYQRSPEWKKLAETTQSQRRHYLRLLEQDLAEWRACDVRRRTLKGMRDIIASDRGPGAADCFIMAAGALFNYAIKSDWEGVEANPAHGIDKLSDGEITPWTEEQFAYACARLAEPLRRACIVARFTAQRRSDIIRMVWSDYTGGTIKVRQQKTGAQLVIPAHPVLKLELDEWRRTTQSTHILVSAAGKPWTNDAITNALARAMTGMGLGELSIHGLRKLACASLAEAGCSAHEIKSISGHASLQQVEHYTKSADQARLATDAIAKLGNVFQLRRENKA